MMRPERATCRLQAPGREIRDEKDAAKVAITYGDARRGRVELDVLASEVDDLAGKGRKVAKRGRKPKGAA